MAYTLNRRIAELIDSNGQLVSGSISNGYISTDHLAGNSITQGKLHSTFALPASAIGALNTSNLSESGNLYYTNARADARIAAANTGDLTEGSNLYYVDSRVQTYISGNRSYGIITGTTATASGGTNTTALASTAFVQQEITTLIGGAPSTLNDLNELAAAINDDANYNTTLTTALATKLPLAGGTLTGSLTIPDKIVHAGDTNTYLEFNGADQFRVVTGGVERVAFYNTEIHFNDGGTNVDFIVETSGNPSMLVIDGGTNHIGIGKNNPVTPLDIAFPLLTSATQKNELVLESRANGSTAQTGALTGITFNNRTNLYVAGSFNSTAGIYGVQLDTAIYGRSLGLDFYTSAIDGTATSKLRIDGAGKVGIGTNGPAGKLHVYSGDAGTVTPSAQADDLVVEASTEGGITIMTPNDQSARIRFTSPATESGDLGGADIFYRQNINKMSIGTTVSGGKLAFKSGAGVETMVLNGGNVLVGKSTPNIGVVGQELRGDGSNYFTSTNDTALGLNRLASDGTVLEIRRQSAIVGAIGTYGGDLWVGQGNTGLIFNDGGDVIHVANASGGDRNGVCDLGNTASRFKDIHLSGNVNAHAIRVMEGTSLAGGIFKEKNVTGTGSSNDLSFFAESVSGGGDIHFMTGGSATKRATINSAGNLALPTGTARLIVGAAIGTATLYGTTSVPAVGIFGQSAYASCGAHIEIAGDSDISWSPIYINKFDWSAGKDSRWLAFGVNGFGTDSANISYDGTNFALTNASDYRLKENIVDYSGGLAKIEELQVRSYNKKEGVSKDITQEGFIAHEAAAANIPGLVVGERDATKENEAGDTVPDYQSINREALIPYLVSAIQELKAENNALKARVETLEG